MSESRLSIVHVASEMAPLAKVGGLADVVSALGLEQARRGHRVIVVIPAYRDLGLPPGWTRKPIGGASVPWGMGSEAARFEICQAGDSGPRVLLVGHAGDRRFFDRPGIYDDARTGEGYADNGERFLFFSRAALEGLKHLGERFDVLHTHDQQAAWVPCFVRTHEAYEPAFREVANIFTIHNLGYQGIHDAWVLGLAGFGGQLFFPSSPFEYWGRVNFMKVGIAFADLITTVSPRYAKEIQASGEFGFGLEGVLARRSADLRGILNGIDDEVWNPARDAYLTGRYGVDDLAGKAVNRRALIERVGLDGGPDRPLIGMVTRLAEQKGIDLIEEAAEELMRLEARFVILGSGQPRYEELFRKLETEHPERLVYVTGHDESLAHLIIAGSDLFLMPSRYEPCGLGQLYALRYGTPPVVREVGGLADTVRELKPLTGEGTGFLFQRYEPGDLVAVLRRALAFHHQPEIWRTLQRNGMSQDFSWRKSADAYDRVYLEAIERVKTGRVLDLEAARAQISLG